ncbi:MAG: hypothetical protein D6736_07800 [Nitrospinota bacterium]|nr:MAG: hypothetical protein D6736_07800 [Nitrospinota bacterium]
MAGEGGYMTLPILVIFFLSLVLIGVESLLLFLSYRRQKVLIARLRNTQRSYENRIKHSTTKFEDIVRQQERKIEALEKELEHLKSDEEKEIFKDMVVARLKSEIELLKQRIKSGETINNTLLVRQTLRSGERIFADENLVLIGDINPGAEVVAGGDIFALGKLRGVAQAGMPDNTSAVIFALDLQPMQLRIGPCIRQAFKQELKRTAIPEIARVVADQVRIESFRLWYGKH